jgi:hypothetical protein
VAHTCDPSYSGGRDQEDCGLKPTRAKEFTRPYLEKTRHKKKKSWRSGSRCRPWVQAWCHYLGGSQFEISPDIYGNVTVKPLV